MVCVIMAAVAIVEKGNRPAYMVWHIWTEMIQQFDENVGVHESFSSNCYSASSNVKLVHTGMIQLST